MEKPAAGLSRAGFTLWDIFNEKTSVTSITYENNQVDKVISGIDSGTGVRGMKDFRTYYGFTNSPEKLEETAASVAGGAFSGAESFEFSAVEPRFINKIEIMPGTVSVPEKIKLLENINETVRSAGPAIKQVNVTYAEKVQDIEIMSDLARFVKEQRVYTSFIIHVIAEKGGRVETAYGVYSAYAGFELIKKEDIVKKARETAESAMRLLSADKRITGEMTAVISSEAGGTLIHEAVGHSLEADIVQKGMSEYGGKKGRKVASELVTVIDDTPIPNKRGSFSFDDEGIFSQKTVLVEKGMLKNFMYDRETAIKEGVESTGNGRRENYRYRPIPRMTNTMIAPGQGSPADLIKDTKKGIYIEKMGGGQVNTVTGEFIFEVKKGTMIENGKLTYPLRDATLMGRGPDVLNSIDAVCGDLGFEVGTCGKDGQGVPVSDAQPTLRIPRILIGSK